MADYVKIPTDLFENQVISELDADAVLLYLHLLCETQKTKGVFSIGNITLTDAAIGSVFKSTNTHFSLIALESYGLIERRDKSIMVFKAWNDPHDRNSPQYKEWRKAVFARDGFKCQKCGTKKDLQAHHKKSWKKNKVLRYEVSNGITLCRKCHLESHGGSWRNV